MPWSHDQEAGLETIAVAASDPGCSALDVRINDLPEPQRERWLDLMYQAWRREAYCVPLSIDASLQHRNNTVGDKPGDHEQHENDNNSVHSSRGPAGAICQETCPL
jgi:hypothetical protein